jgi:hypothetical protein
MRVLLLNPARLYYLYNFRAMLMGWMSDQTIQIIPVQNYFNIQTSRVNIVLIQGNE